ncbi:MAG: M48 family metallopeptidase [Bacilli bacterium]|nr:M48 family metallopeptidase [Bacilli bacterium]
MILRDVRKNKSKTAFIVTCFVIFVAIFIYFVSLWLFEDTYLAIIIGVMFSFFTSFISYYNSDKIVLSINKARPANKEEDREINNILEGLCLATGLPKPKLYVMEDPSMNAFATGRNPENAVICVTTGLLERLNKNEIEGVLAHELSHVKNYDILLSTVATVMVGFVVLLSELFRRVSFRRKRDDDNGGNILAIIGLIFIILAPIFSKLLQLALSRNREYLADSSAVEITRNKEGLISALKKLTNDNRPLKTANEATASMFIVNPYNAKKVKDSLLSTHPATENRIKALENIK